MNKHLLTLAHSLASLAITAWVGSLWAIGYLAVPILFHAQPDKQLAGMLAGQMFSAAAYLGMVCGMYLLLQRIGLAGRAALRQQMFWVIAAMLLITLLLLFAIQPVMAELKAQALPREVMHSAFADRFKLLHGFSSILYLIESLLGAFLVIRTYRT
ncbi:MAG: DUF4149 domain-containing protein [Nitrosomonadales bacterium]|nr:DUF4149 domain-containing protein [Nitrosomonadales bacterium]